jgi:hypothetical protein
VIAVHDIEGEQQRDAEARFLDRHALHLAHVLGAD